MRALLWLIAGGALYWAVRELFGRGRVQGSPDVHQGEAMVRDPQCGVYVPLSSAIKRRIRGDTVYFCSRECEEAHNRKSGD